jgi:hypothetical protein
LQYQALDDDDTIHLDEDMMISSGPSQSTQLHDTWSIKVDFARLTNAQKRVHIFIDAQVCHDIFSMYFADNGYCSAVRMPHQKWKHSLWQTLRPRVLKLKRWHQT